MPVFPDTSVYGRGTLATNRLLAGDPKGVIYSLFQPEMLSPEQTKGFVPQDNSLISTAFRTMANPLVIAGLALSMIYPAALSKNMFRTHRSIKGAMGTMEMINPYTKALPRGIYRFMSSDAIFGGTTFGKFFNLLVEKVHGFKNEFVQKLALALVDTENVMGTKAIDYTTQAATFARIEGWGGTQTKMGRWLRSATEQTLKEAVKAGEMTEGRAKQLLERAWQYSDGTGDALRAASSETFEDHIRRILTESYEKLILEPGNLENLAEMKLARGEGVAGSFKEALMRGSVKALPRKFRDEFVSALNTHGVVIQDLHTKEGMKVFMQQLGKALMAKDFRFIEGYMPHVETRTSDQIWEALQKLYEETPASLRAKRMAATERQITSSLRDRRWGMVPSLDDYQHVSGFFTPETEEVLRLMTGAQVQDKSLGMILPKYRQYSLRTSAVMERYIHGAGRVYGWSAKGLGSKLKGAAEEMANTPGVDPVKVHLAKSTYIPAAMGAHDEATMMQSLGFSYWKKKAHDFFNNPTVRQMTGEKMASQMQSWMRSPQVQDLTLGNASAKLAGWLYLSTLGGNPASAGLNMLQNLMTTAGVVEPRYLIRGLGRATEDIGKVVETYAKGGVTLEQAFEKALPHYVEMLGSVGEYESMAALSRARYGASIGQRGFATLRASLMAMFTGSERFNKLWAFHAGREKAIAEGMKGKFPDWFGRKVMEVTQFPGGVERTASALVKANPIVKQFMHFPLRVLELMTMRGGQLGAAEKTGWLGWNWGTTGRMMAAGGLVYGAGQAAGVDLSRGLVFGALPAPFGEDAPFYPFPVVPPAIGMVGAVASDIYGGKFEQIPKALPLAVPGGVALTRAATAVAPGVAKALGRSYADYGNRLPSGEVGIYSSDGALKGYKTPMRMFADALGWSSLTGDPEAELTSYLLKQRDRIRDYRRRYLDAFSTNNMDKADRIQSEFQRVYPQLGKIMLKDSDIRAVHLRHEVSRVERLMETMPGEARAVFGPMVSMAMTEAGTMNLGIPTEALREGGTIGSREALRTAPRESPSAVVRQALGGQPEMSQPSSGRSNRRQASNRGGTGFAPLLEWEGF